MLRSLLYIYISLDETTLQLLVKESERPRIPSSEPFINIRLLKLRSRDWKSSLKTYSSKLRFGTQTTRN